MKKILISLMLALLVMGLCANAAAAQERHPHQWDHCECGGAAIGVGDHTQCQVVEWISLSKALEDVGRTVSTADFGKLPSGNYYLDGDVVVTATSAIGSKADALATEPDTVKNLKICLNGYSITRSGKGRVFGYMHMNSSLTICDCSYDGTDFAGTVTGGETNYGGLIYTYSKSVLNIYGGNFIGYGNTNGGTFAAACDGCGDVDGDKSYTEKDRSVAEPSFLNIYNGYITGSTVSATGGTIQLFHKAAMNMYGGTIIGGTAGTNGGAICGNKGTLQISGGNIVGGTATNLGGAIYSGGPVYISGGTMTGGVNKAGTEVVQVIGNDGKLIGTYTTLVEGLKQNSTGRYLRLLNDLEADDTLSGTVYLDLNGHTLKGIKITGTLYGMDCTTNGYDDSAAGSLIPASGKPATHVKTTQEQVGAVRSYLALEQDGSYSFHRFYVGITKVTLKPATVGMGYKATFAGGERVAAALKSSMAFGYKMWISGGGVIKRGYSADKFEKTQEVTLRIDNFLDPSGTTEENAQRAETDVYAVAFLQLADGTLMESTQVCYDLHQMLELADNAYAGYSESQREALTELSVQYSQMMLGWNVENTHHAEGSIWEAVDAAGFKKKMTLRSGSTNYYNLKAGTYVLTEDVELGDGKLCIPAGKTVSICLNGHTITTSNRMFEQYGTLNICDCHEADQEGGMTSTLAGESAAYAPIAYCRYNSTTNIYGGNMKATGKVTSAGVFALSHDGGDSNASKPAAVMNIYGGSVSGGQVYNHGGLISIWNKAKLNMYGGELYGGSADIRGGAVDLNTTGGEVNIYGGVIRDCSSITTGGAIHSAYGITSIYGGSFYNNTATTYGGAVYCGSGKLWVTGGDFYNNTAGIGGGAIRLYGRTVEAHLGGAAIHGNTAAETGDGVLLTKTHLDLAGDLQITGNTADNLYIDFYSTVNGDDLTAGAQVNVTPEAMTAVATKAQAASYFKADNADYKVSDAYGNVVLMQSDVTPASAVSGFQAGFGESNITPKTIDGMPLQGYSNATKRLAVDEGRKSYDDIMAQSVAITDENGVTVILIFCDLITCNSDLFDYVVDAVAAATGVPEQNIFLNFSHSHSVPSVTSTSMPIVVEYNKTLPNLFARSALQAMNDRAPATMETGSFEVQQTVNGKTQYYNFYRHYTTEVNGVLQYFGDQFGEAVYNSTTKPIRDADHTMHLVRFVRDGKNILMSNWRIHPHFTGGESQYKLSADAIGTIRYYMEQELPDTHYVYFQGAAGNMNETSRLTASRNKSYGSPVQNHGLGYVAYGEAVAKIIVNNLGCLKSAETGLLQVDHYDYLAKIDTPSDEEYANAKAVYDVYVVETEGMTLGEKNIWVRNYCAEHPEYDYTSAFQLGFIINRRATESDTYIPLNVVSLGKSFAFFTGPFEMWDSISMEVEEASPFKTTFCLGYSMAHYHYLVYYPEYADQQNGVPYVSYESENRHFKAPQTVRDMIDYWTAKLNEFYNN